ncbi:MAG TPA: tRNA (adenine-N1)-methyltransferase [Armatimonadetes bacterium]|nr:tRNA (adenine-N1)-methyltransferase [Armatimonadota bacterium]
MPRGEVLLLLEDGSTYLLRIEGRAKGRTFSTHKGEIDLLEVAAAEFGAEVRTKKGAKAWVLRPTIHDYLYKAQRVTQIIYPKDIGLILLKLDLTSGRRVLEVGTGSGVMTTALAWAVRPRGRVVTYEVNERFIEVAKRNVERAGLSRWVEFVHADASEGVEGSNFDAAFIDIKHPTTVLGPVLGALKDGAPLGALLPTVNQVQDLIRASGEHGLVDVEVCEILWRPYKPNPERLRPVDRMPAHTGYLFFARKAG